MPRDLEFRTARAIGSISAIQARTFRKAAASVQSGLLLFAVDGINHLVVQHPKFTHSDAAASASRISRVVGTL